MISILTLWVFVITMLLDLKQLILIIDQQCEEEVELSIANPSKSSFKPMKHQSQTTILPKNHSQIYKLTFFTINISTTPNPTTSKNISFHKSIRCDRKKKTSSLWALDIVTLSTTMSHWSPNSSLSSMITSSINPTSRIHTPPSTRIAYPNTKKSKST